MKKKKPHEAAAIEAWEEAGARGTLRKTAVGRYTYLKFLDDGDVVPTIVDLFQIEVTVQHDELKERASAASPGSNRMKRPDAYASWS
jgi:8-oxo-dGTP pyrophosphatase MutT (NUDIX family)